MWLDALSDFWWADRFGWTPTQADELGWRRSERLRAVTVAVDEGRQKRAEQESRSADAGTG